ncbi:hypothetical protein GH714_023078 [Hevea brasiliensis]|uniref:Uncharacterized protein n=1 Tax=Hevea brasiliensis TaxID=3981 RepID=A0A6A6LCQ3_HEVBR|nr:hypothetical protein GH714_023078 [Hevea brasiliensis]
MLAKNEGEVFRPLANFPPTVWGYSFAKFPLLDPEFESYTKEVEVLKQEVKYMLIQSTEKLTDKIEFINLLYHLGVSYHFENKIDEQLNDIFNVLPDLLAQNDYDLHTLAISFQVFRQYGYKMPCDVFNKFKDSDGGFDKTISSDVKGLLSLYEATFLSVHGEDILDEALAFTRQHLETLVAQSSPRLAEHIRNALLRPFYQGIERIKTRQYISFYEGMSLEMKLFSNLQSWITIDCNSSEKVPYIRDRIVEVYLWAVAAHFEPEFALARLMIAKYTKMVSVVDDTYDAYGTIDELQRFTDAFDRFVIYLLLFKDVTKAYFVKAKWFNEGYVPSMKEYMENGLITSTYSVLPAASFIGMENIIGSKEYEWVESNPKTVIASKLICRLMDDITTPNKEEEVFRPLANFPPTIWGYSFAKFSFLDPEFESYTKGVEVLKQEVIHMLMQSTEKLADKIEFINLLCRLGVSYHFENEIEEQLNDIFIVLPDLLSKNDYDLYTLAILFQVLRQYGYKMPCDVFNKFKDSDGGFKKTISSDVKGLLSLYEATFLKRLEARQYICFYEGDESRNETLLKFAKLDYNRLQFFYKQELALLSSWWKDINLAEKLPYIRDRIVEVYLWAVAAHFEPEYTLARLMITKYTKMLSVVDDTYDAYGTIDELRRFTDAFQRCNADAIDEVPEYMKVIYKGLLNLFDETESAGNEEMSSRTSYAKEKFKEIARGYFVEAKWFNEGYVPSMEEYIENGLITSTYSVIPAASFIGMENVMGTKEYEWVENNPKTVIACKLICRLMDDITPDERKRGHCASSVECYMKEHGVSEMEAIAEIQRMCANAWKDMNEECMKPTAVPRVLLKYYVNLARVIDFVYKYMDSYTYCSSLKEDVYSLFLGPLPM